MGIDVVGPVLGVVLDDEYRGLRPELRTADRFDHPPQGEIVFRQVGRSGRLAGAGSSGVVVGKPQDLKPWHLTGGLEAMQLGDEAVGSVQIAVVHVEAAKPGIVVILEIRHEREAGLVGLRGVVDELTVTPITDARLLGAVPKIAPRGFRYPEAALARVGVLAGSVVAVTQRPYLLNIVGGVGASVLSTSSSALARLVMASSSMSRHGS